VAMVPLWQLVHVPMTCAWSTFVAGFQAVVTWQASHTLLVKMWVAFLPFALTPLWQLEQPLVMPVCVKVAGVQASVVWQVPHSWVVAIWFVPLPVAVVPLWHDEQVPSTCVWSTFVAGFQVVVVWQALHVFDVLRCVAPLPVAIVPLWQE